eukprot:gene22123-28228_t
MTTASKADSSSSTAILSPSAVVHTHIYVVTFKRGDRDFVLSARIMAPTVIAVGDLVIVSAERGCEDMGVVRDIVPMAKWMVAKFHTDAVPNFNLNKHTNKIMRIATQRERRMLGMKETDELEVLRSVQQIAAQRFRLNMTISDVEFQFDRRKVTLYYTPHTTTRVDFREFVTTLTALYKTRVWMEMV